MSCSSAHVKREELREKISQNHLAYLAHEDNPCKIEKRKALEGLIAEYLAIVPNREKFIIERIGDVLSHSVFNNQDFSAYKAATAFQSIEKYATNLLSQPWRKEYRNIKMYSGFYKHFIESPLPNAHQIFEAMGYTIQNLELELEEPVDPDPVRHVALDCLVAYVECQIMLQICESVRAFECSWTEIHGVRQNYICSIEEATRILQQMKIAQREEAKSTNKSLLPPLAQPEQIIVTPENTNSVWNDNSPYELLPSQNMLFNLEDDLLGKKNDWPAEPSTRRSKIQLDGLTISRSRRSPSWTEGLNSSPVFNFNLQDDEREGRKTGSKHNYLQYNWQSEGSDPFDVFGNFGSPMVPKNGAKTWSQPLPYMPPIPPQNNPNRPSISGRYESWDLIDHPIIPNPSTVYLPIMMPTPVIRQPLIPAPPPFSSTNTSNLVSPNPYYDYGHRNSKSLPRKMVDVNNERDNQLSYTTHKDKDMYAPDSVDIVGLDEPVNRPKWKSAANVYKPLELLDDPATTYGGNSTNTFLSKFENMGLTDLKPKTLPNNRNQMGLKVGVPLESKTNENKKNPFAINENGKTHSREPDLNSFQSALGDITFQNDNSSGRMTKRNSFYDNVPMIDSDNGLPSGCLSLGGTSSLISHSIEKDNHQTAKNGYRNDTTTSLDRNDYQKIISAHMISNGEKSSDKKDLPDVKIEQWSCAFCTYINTKSDHICEICGRSKEPAVEISPLESGGKQCPKCTLVNDKDSSNCSACDMSLKDCATYI